MSYNEESGRYKKLDPVFWIPREERPMCPVEGYKAAKPRFDKASLQQYICLVTRMKHAYRVAYKAYEDSIADGISNEVARAVLPVGIYSSCWVTTNVRNLMQFLSLRTHDETASFVSYPQREIEEAAIATELILAKGWPLTHRAFIEAGRVC